MRKKKISELFRYQKASSFFVESSKVVLELSIYDIKTKEKEQKEHSVLFFPISLSLDQTIYQTIHCF